MSRIYSSVFVIVFVFLFYSIVPHATAITFPTDNIQLYENGIKVTDNSYIWQASYKTYIEPCQNGVCSIEVQFYPVMIYKLNIPLSNQAMTSNALQQLIATNAFSLQVSLSPASSIDNADDLSFDTLTKKTVLLKRTPFNGNDMSSTYYPSNSNYIMILFSGVVLVLIIVTLFILIKKHKVKRNKSL